MNKYYLPIIFIVGLINWAFNLPIYLPFLIIVMGLIIYFDLERKYILPLILFFPLVFQVLMINPFTITCYAIIILLLLHDIYIKEYFKINAIFIIMACLLLVMGLSLLFTVSTSLSLLGILKYYIYILCFYYAYNIKDFNKKSYVLKSLFAISLLILAEIFIYFISQIGINYKTLLADLDLGWGSFNEISLIYLLLTPIAGYDYLINSNKTKYLYWIFFNISMVFLMMTRGSYIAMLFMAIPFLMHMYNHAENKGKVTKQFLFYIIIALLFQLLVSTPTGMTELWYKRINNLTISFSNTDLLVDLGIKLFKVSPIFGSGVNTSSIYLSLYNVKMFPNYMVETLATLGLIGLFIFIMYLVIVIRCTKGSLYNQYARYAFLIIVIQGLFATSFYNFVIMIILSIILSCLDENKKGEMSTPELT